jgi:hypothetical protein
MRTHRPKTTTSPTTTPTTTKAHRNEFAGLAVCRQKGIVRVPGLATDVAQLRIRREAGEQINQHVQMVLVQAHGPRNTCTHSHNSTQALVERPAWQDHTTWEIGRPTVLFIVFQSKPPCKKDAICCLAQ